MIDVTVFSALLGGLLTFLAPCTLPLIPAYLGFLGGSVVGEKARQDRILWNAFLFTLGFSFVFVSFGLVSGSLGRFLILNRALVSEIGGAVIILFGINMLGVLSIPSLFKGKTLPNWLKPGNPWSAFALGFLFALGWSPCLGPILGTILILAAGTSATAIHGAFLLLVYSLGLAIPFLLMAYLYSKAFTYVSALAKYVPVITKCAGVLLIVIGIMMVFGKFGLLNELFGNWKWFTDLVNYM